MSAQTIQVDQFLLNKLQPEIDRLNLSLISMEENGYDNYAMRITRDKLNKLVPIYDFLKEYAYGKEELDSVTLETLMDLVGTYSLSNKSIPHKVLSTRDSLGVNDTTCLDFIRIYRDGEILNSLVLYPSVTPTSFQIYVPDTVIELEVIVYMSGLPPTTYTGINNIHINNINISVVSELYMEITTKSICGETTTITQGFTVDNQNCTAPIYWLGSTTERFTIGDTDINETSDITINPNLGTITSGVKLNYEWITSNTIDMTQYTFAGDTTQIIETIEGDAHILLLIPEIYRVATVHEVVGESKIAMTAGLHYDTFTIINSKSLIFTCMYIRDLTDFSLPVRSIQIAIEEV